MALYDSDGNVLYGKVEFKIIFPDRVERPKPLKAMKGKGWTDAQVDEMLMEFADKDLEVRYPRAEFRLAEVGPAKFNFIFVGEKGSPEAKAHR